MREPGLALWLALGCSLACASSCGAASSGAGPDGGSERRRDSGRIRVPDAGPGADAGDTVEGLGPPYPIVLAHGFFGFEDFAGLDFITYFYGVRADLMARGEPLVFTPAVDPFGSSDLRGAELLAHVERILDETGYAKVNLIGHSQGGLDARWVAHMRPELVASVTTFATPHRGSPVADVVLEIIADTRLQALADQLIRVIGAPLWDAAGEETSVFEALRQLSSAGIDDYNARIINRAGVAYFSVTGRTDGHDGGPDCQVDDAPPFIQRYRREVDPVDPLLSIPEQIIEDQSGRANDGLVAVFDARWGRFLGCVPADHLDEIGHLFGDSPGFGNAFDHRAFYRDLVAWLRAEGF